MIDPRQLIELQKFESSIGKIVLKNTFYDVEEPENQDDFLVEPQLQRAKTVPARFDDHEASCDTSIAFMASSPPDLQREVTYDAFEGVASLARAPWEVTEQQVGVALPSVIDMMTSSCDADSEICRSELPSVGASWSTRDDMEEMPTSPVRDTPGNDASVAVAASNPPALQRDVTYNAFEGADSLACYPWGVTEQQLWMQVPSGIGMIPSPTSAHLAMMPQQNGAFQPQALSVTQGDNGISYVRWTVDARKLQNSDRVAVSPYFELFDAIYGALLPYKLMLSPSGGASFRKANGKGVIQLKCEAPRSSHAASPLTSWFAVSSGRVEEPKFQEARGPVTEDLTRSGMCGLPKDEEVWNFSLSVDKPSKTFVICLAVLEPWRT